MAHFWFGGGGPQSGPQGDSAPVPAELSKEFKLLEPARVRFALDGSKLMARIEGQEAPVTVTLYRLFAVSAEEGWLSALDEKGHEVGIVQDLREFDKESQSAVRESLRRRYAVPKVLRVISAKERFDLVEWEVETDRGPRKILLRDPRGNFQQRDQNRLTFTDLDGNRFEILDLSALDAKSRVILERYL